MANEELTRLRGRLALAENSMQTIRNGIGVDIDELRMLLDRHAAIEELQPERINLVADRLSKMIHKGQTLLKQISAIKQDLGDE